MQNIKITFYLVTFFFLTINNCFSQITATTDFVSTSEDSLIRINVQVNDSNENKDCPVMGSHIYSAPSNGIAYVDNDGVHINYNPNPNYYGRDSFRYDLKDCVIGSTISDTAWVFIEINAVNDPPIAAIDFATLEEDQNVLVDVQANDLDPEGNVLITSPTENNASNGQGLIIENSKILYIPNENFFGKDSIQYVVCDNSLGSQSSLCDTSWVYFTVNPVDDGISVSINKVFESTEEDVSKCFIYDSILVNVDAPLDTVTWSSENSNLTFELQENGATEICYFPEENFNGFDTAYILVCDPHENCQVITFYMDVIPVEDPLNNKEDEVIYTLTEDSFHCSNYYDLVDNIDGNTVSAANISVYHSENIVMNSEDSTICYTPPANFNGQDTFIIEICNEISCAQVHVVYIITPIDDDITAVPDSLTMIGSNSSTINVLDNDINPDSDVLTVTITEQPNSGTATVQADGTIKYESNSNTTYLDIFYYSITDGAHIDTTFVWVFHIDKDAIQANDDQIDANESEPAIINIVENDEIDDLLDFNVSLLEESTIGTITLNPDGTVTFEGNEQILANEEIPYVICSESEYTDKVICDTAIIYISLLPENVNPKVPNSFSPNDDGQNDVLVIESNELIQDPVLQVFNRWGDIIYFNEEYDNSWDGTNYKTGKNIVEGVYFYTYQYNTLLQKNKKLTGYIVLKR